MVRHLRRGQGKNGLVLANGGTVTYQHVICLSSQPRKDGSPYPIKNPLPDNLESESHPVVDTNGEGEVSIEVSTPISLPLFTFCCPYDLLTSSDIYG